MMQNNKRTVENERSLCRSAKVLDKEEQQEKYSKSYKQRDGEGREFGLQNEHSVDAEEVNGRRENHVRSETRDRKMQHTTKRD